jgi:hypothetical protein
LRLLETGSAAVKVLFIFADQVFLLSVTSTILHIGTHKNWACQSLRLLV